MTMTASHTTVGMNYACHGRNHSDTGTTAECPRCGLVVVKGAKGQLATLGHGSRGTVYYCWVKHECTDAQADLHAAVQAQAVLAGRAVKGAEVEVFKGRKVAVGTVGVVRWAAQSDFGARVGLAIDGVEDLVYTAASNVRPTAAAIATAQAVSDAYAQRTAATQARLDEIPARQQALVASTKARLAAASDDDAKTAILTEAMAATDRLMDERRDLTRELGLA